MDTKPEEASPELTREEINAFCTLMKGPSPDPTSPVIQKIDKFAEMALRSLQEGVWGPREPTAEMEQAGNKADEAYSNNRFGGDGHLSRAAFVYKAMIGVIAPEEQPRQIKPLNDQLQVQPRTGEKIMAPFLQPEDLPIATSEPPDRASSGRGTLIDALIADLLVAEIDALEREATPEPWEAVGPHTDGSGQLRGAVTGQGPSTCIVPFKVTAIQDIRLMAALRNAWKVLKRSTKE